MLTQEEHVEIQALGKRRWSYSAIARHLGIARNTVKAYLREGRRPGERRRLVPDPFERIEEYVRERLREDQHVWGSALYDEVVALGYPQSYVTFARQILLRELRPWCEASASRRGQVPTIRDRFESGEYSPDLVGGSLGPQ
jgi:transposase